ncbi:MAG TPA: Rossmann-like and DUF2520 domain-containing protein [Gemmatimonadales bacterium]
MSPDGQEPGRAAGAPPAAQLQPVAIIGAGRMGRGMALALERAGIPAPVLGRVRRAHDTLDAGLLLLAVPDDVIGAVAAELAQAGAVTGRQVVLHLSGLLDRRALAPLEPTAAGLGSFHPLQSVARASEAPGRLAGAFAAIEGDERALAAGERLAAALGMRPVRLQPGAKPAYHAGAVIASNYLVVLADLAERIAREAGIPAEDATKLYLPLMRGTVANLEQGPAVALTGPVRRGDAATVRAHLKALSAGDREIYRVLGRAALELARRAGLSDEAAVSVARELDGGEP